MPINLLHKKNYVRYVVYLTTILYQHFVAQRGRAVILAMEQKNRDPLIRHIYCWSLNYLCAPSLPLCWLWKWKRKKITHSSIFHNYFKRRMMHCIHGLDCTWKCRCLLFVAWFFFRWFAKYWKYRIKIFIICWDSIDHIRKTYAKFGV